MPIELITKKQNIELVVPAGKGVAEAYEKGYADAEALTPEFFENIKTVCITSLNMFKTPVVEITFGERFNGSFLNFCMIGEDETLSNKIVEHITVNARDCKITTMQQMFYCSNNYNLDRTLKHITINFDTTNVSSYNNSFRGYAALEVIDGEPLDLSNATALNSTFSLSSSLKEVRVVPNSIKVSLIISASPYLSDETVESIIAGLADLTDTTAKTLTLNRTVGNKLTDAQREAIAAKNWTLSY